MAKKKKADKARAAAATLGDSLRVSDDAVIMAAIGGTSFIQVAMAMTPEQRRRLHTALFQMLQLVEEMDPK